MGGGDLNLKKSWHPSTLRNIERVWKAEQKHEAEKQKIEQLQKELAEERAREEIQAFAEDQGVVKRKGERLDWMYQGPAALVNREEYLLGRKVDKTFEILQQQENGSDAPKEEERQPGSIFCQSSVNTTVDLANKIREDPLFSIMKKEKEERKTLLNNPVRMKHLQQLLKQSLAKEKKKKKKSKKHRKNKPDSDSSDSSSSDSEDNGRNAKKQKQEHPVKQSRLDKGENFYTHTIKKEKETFETEKYSQEKHSNCRRSPDLREANHYNRKAPQSSRTSSLDYKSRESSDRPSHDYKSRESSDRPSHDYKSRESSDRPNNGYKSRESSDRPSNGYKSRESSDRPSNGYKSRESSERQNHISSHDSSKYKQNHEYSSRESSDRKNRDSFTNEDRKQVKKKLSDEDKERLRQEMLDNARWREEQRQRNVERYQKEDQKEKTGRKGDASEFIKPMLSKAASRGTVENRVRQKIFTIQRRRGDMDKNFVRR